MKRAALHLVIHGRVQGVGYRWWVQGAATALGLVGWVRNRREGTVELLAIGSPRALDELVEACRIGPPRAGVRAIDQTPAEDDGSIGFVQRGSV